VSNSKRIHDDFVKELTAVLMISPSLWESPSQFRLVILGMFKKYYGISPTHRAQLPLPDWQ